MKTRQVILFSILDSIMKPQYGGYNPNSNHTIVVTTKVIIEKYNMLWIMLILLK